MDRHDAEQVFAAFNRFSEHVHKLDERRKLRQQLASAEARQCGNCDHWMKSSLCPIDDQRKGFPSHSYPGCGKFQLSVSTARRIQQLRTALQTDGSHDASR